MSASSARTANTTRSTRRASEGRRGCAESCRSDRWRITGRAGGDRASDGCPKGNAGGDRLDVLATLVEAWEARHVPIDAPDPIAAIRS